MKLDFSVIINKAIKRIRSDITSHVANSKQLNETGYTPNKKSVADRKGFNKRLVGKGKRFLRPSTYKITDATASNQVGILSFARDKDAEIGKFNQTPTGSGAIAKADGVEFFGVSEKAEKDFNKDIDKYIDKTVDREIESWGFKKV